MEKKDAEIPWPQLFRIDVSPWCGDLLCSTHGNDVARVGRQLAGNIRENCGRKFFVLTISTALVALSWSVSRRRGSIGRLKWWLAGSTAMTGLAWVIVFNEARINEYLIMQM
ncbi:hypothetical protein [Ruegeria sp. Ofav3-42]|uniref:hypothetical protein n=1 Tax=Ruegeria sp. Ofav3-42 TaxID=2917759 RepID=UPI001EF64751|nr:hypothetical protein [Ruegeria sp. Ofav3-42]MCG7522349.1 hypothetical protein [Ruegeria sp. Ofav3-42]